MKKSRVTETRIVAIPKQADAASRRGLTQVLGRRISIVHFLTISALTALLIVGALSTTALAQHDDEAKVQISSAQVERICGWFENPTPANAWITDRQGEWIIGLQGGHQAEGSWPEFDEGEWVKTNIHYGYGCACVDSVLNKEERLVVRIVTAASQPLGTCKRDKEIADLEPAK